MATIASLAIAAIGAAVSAYAAYASAQQQQQNLRTTAVIEEHNAAVQEEAGREAAKRQRKADAALQNSFRARAAGANVVAGTGSSLLKELNFAEDSELQALNVQHGYDVRSAESKTKSNFAKYQADRISPETQAGISLLSSASSVATSYGTKGAGSQTGGGLNANSPGIVPTRNTYAREY
jgi:adenine-specific DNA methylase